MFTPKWTAKNGDKIEVARIARGSATRAWAWNVKVNGAHLARIFRWHSGPYQIKIGDKTYITKRNNIDDIVLLILEKNAG